MKTKRLEIQTNLLVVQVKLGRAICLKYFISVCSPHSLISRNVIRDEYDRLGSSLSTTIQCLLSGFNVYIEDSVALKTIIKYDEDGNQGNTWVVYQTNYSVESTRGLSKDGMKQLINDSWAEALGDGTLLSEMRKVEAEVIGVSTGMEAEEAEAADEEGACRRRHHQKIMTIKDPATNIILNPATKSKSFLTRNA